MALLDNASTVPEIDGRQFAFQAGQVYSKHPMVLVATAVLYPVLTPRDSALLSRSLLATLLGLGASAAYGLGCDLTFYQGFWGLGRVFTGFSFLSLLWSLACCAFGFAVVKGMYRLTELCRAVDEGRSIVRRSASTATERPIR